MILNLDLPRVDVPEPQTVKVLNRPLGARPPCPEFDSPRKSALAASSSTTSKGTYSFRRHLKGREVVLYHPPSTSITFPGGIDHSVWENGEFSIEKSTISFVKERLNVVDECIKFRDSVSSKFIQTAVVDQAHDEIPFRNARAVVTFDRYNKVNFVFKFDGITVHLKEKIIDLWSSLVKLDPARIASSTPSVSLHDAMKATENTLEGKAIKRKDPDLTKYLEYLAKEDGSAVLTYALAIIDAAISRRMQVFVDAHSGHIVSIVDLVLNASPHNDFISQS